MPPLLGDCIGSEHSGRLETSPRREEPILGGVKAARCCSVQHGDAAQRQHHVRHSLKEGDTHP